MKFLRLAFVVLFVIVVVACSSASNMIVPITPVNVERYGEDAPAIWTPLNKIEMDSIIKAQNNFDHEAKLLLSIFLTSNFRDSEPVNACLNVYRKFIAKCDKELSEISDPKEKAEKLHQLFFKEFIKTPREKNGVGSGMAGILLIKEYDVNTANLLFGIIAAKYGYSIEMSFAETEANELKSSTGLIMNGFSGKSYLTLKHEKLYSGITLIPYLEKGFDVYINLGFFDELHKSHGTLFDSASVELQRFYKKKDFDLRNMLFLSYKINKVNEEIDSEHASIHRRVEMAALFSDSCDILIDRLWVWRNIYPILMKKDIPGELTAFVKTINSELQRTEKICGDELEFAGFAWDLFLFSSFEFANVVDGENMKKNVINAYKYLSPAAVDYEKKKHFLTRSIYHYIDEVVKNNLINREFQNAKEIIDAILENDIRNEVFSYFYSKLGEYYLNRKDYWRAGQYYTECAFHEHRKYQHQCTQKGLNALHTYAESCIKNGVCATAADARDLCLEKMPNKDVCRLIENLYNKNCK
jgi:hypothetical protein